jgi:transcriptional regulator with XRE-family HTH domain
VRENAGVPLRQVARQANMSHGHLSKVEHGEPGRPVTPRRARRLRKATGIRLTGIAGHGPTDPTNGGWRRGRLSEARRRTLNAKIAAVAIGGPLSEQLTRILYATGRPITLTHIQDPDAIQIEHVAALCTSIDLQYGGGVADQMARALLRWAVGLLEVADPGDPAATRLHAAIAALAQRAGWAAFDANTHDVARSLFTVALYAATRADYPDLRAHIIADLAA